MTTKEPSDDQLRLLSEVVERRVSRTRTGWRVTGQSSTPTESRYLNAFQNSGWITVPGTAQDLHSLRPGESIGATITDEGTAVLARCWPEWSPTSLTTHVELAPLSETGAAMLFNPGPTTSRKSH
ncbi:hypothetical protein [Lentzea sp. NBRC 102530]|uniref:hypothetical protein n=1 Tax=Lentzea sp. NBRC 102530 TaxID=3032201 RepID=UPI0024A39157|nr:hypothetical protein [Lentzea sp. NBRC 102530]GLY54897.1 hypothetical protein Lesp01_85520 [Lentzea sp. NBRC 102530]